MSNLSVYCLPSWCIISSKKMCNVSPMLKKHTITPDLYIFRHFLSVQVGGWAFWKGRAPTAAGARAVSGCWMEGWRVWGGGGPLSLSSEKQKGSSGAPRLSAAPLLLVLLRGLARMTPTTHRCRRVTLLDHIRRCQSKITLLIDPETQFCPVINFGAPFDSCALSTLKQFFFPAFMTLLLNC